MEDKSSETLLYEAAVDALLTLHGHKPPKNLMAYNNTAYLQEAQLLTDWYLPAVTGLPTPAIKWRSLML